MIKRKENDLVKKIQADIWWSSANDFDAIKYKDAHKIFDNTNYVFKTTTPHTHYRK